MKKARVANEVFDLYPDFYRGIVVVNDMTNQPSNDSIGRLLEEEIARQAGVDWAPDSRIQAWETAHKKFGSSPGKYPPSIKSLLKRIQSNPSLPFINAAVALFNYLSIKYRLPCGGDDVDTIVGDLVLGRADGTETFWPLGGDREESPVPGEVIYYDSTTGNVMCRRWNWRNGDRTKIEVSTKRVVINVDCLPPVTPEIGDQARDELARLLREHCRAEVRTGALHRGKREMEVI